jgi:CubicO group peptidase (beta-lactamase class C family)
MERTVPSVRIPTPAELQELVEAVVRDTGVPGIAVAASLAGHRCSARAGTASLEHGQPLREESRFKVSCLMKFFVSLLALDLSAQGRLRLDAPACEYLPELRGAEPAQRIQVRHLMSHTSGYRGLDITDARVKWGSNWPRFAESFRRAEMLFEPGSVFNYEHSEHVILGAIIASLCAEPAPGIIAARLLAPLGITAASSPPGRTADSYVGEHRYDRSCSAFAFLPSQPFGPFWESSLSDWTLTLSECLAVVETLLHRPKATQGAQSGDGSRVQLSSEHVEALWEPVVAIPKGVSTGALSERTPRAFSIACGHYPRKLAGHNGSAAGQTCAIRFERDAQLAIAVGVNAWAPHARDRLMDRVIDRSLGGLPSASLRQHRDRSFELRELTGELALEELAGTYHGGFQGEAHVHCHKDALAIRFGRPGSSSAHTLAVELQGTGRYVLNSNAPCALRFFPDPTTGAPCLMSGVHSYKRVSGP